MIDPSQALFEPERKAARPQSRWQDDVVVGLFKFDYYLNLNLDVETEIIMSEIVLGVLDE